MSSQSRKEDSVTGSDNSAANAPARKKIHCGLIMPISSIDGISSEHWVEVRDIVTQAIESAGDFEFSVRLVSDADESGVIQKRIVQNVYNSDIVVCDVSAKNPNVMFELGMRLAFDKSTVIIKDDKTDYSFDTGIIEHILYPRDLRYSKIVDFQEALASKVVATYRASTSEPAHSPFLKNFGKFQIATLTQTEVAPDKLVIEMLSEMQGDIGMIKRRTADPSLRQRGTLDDRAQSALPRVAAAVRLYRRRNKVPMTAELMYNDDLYRFVESEIEAPQYFRNPQEFRNALELVIRTLS